MLAQQVARAKDRGDTSTARHFARRLAGYDALIGAHYAAARTALRLCRMYAAEPGSSGRREAEMVAAVRRHRGAIARLRGGE